MDALGQPLVVDAIIGPRSSESIGLFNAAVQNSSSITDANIVLADINRLDAPRWIDLPTSGTNWSLSVAGSETWGTSWSLDVLNAAGSALSGQSLNVLRASRKTGGAIPGVSGHVAGRDLELNTGSQQASGSSWTQPFYRTHTVNSANYLAGRTDNDPSGSSHVIRRLTGQGLSTAPDSKAKIRLFGDSSGQTPATLTGVQGVSPSAGNADAWILLQLPGISAPLLRRILSVNSTTSELTLESALPSNVSAGSPVTWSLYHTVELATAASANGLVQHQASNANAELLLMGLAPLMVDPVTGYEVARVAAQVRALNRARPNSGARVERIAANDPRLWGLPGTTSYFDPDVRTIFATGATGPLRVHVGTSSSPSTVAAALQSLNTDTVGLALAQALNQVTPLPLVGESSLGSSLALSAVLTPQLALTGDISQVASLSEIANVLTASGYTVDSQLTAAQLLMVDPTLHADYLTFHSQSCQSDSELRSR